VKEKVLEKLKQNTDRYVSGEALSELMGVSRTAVWKHINELKKEGYEIDSSSKKGYRLVAIPDAILACEISDGLSTSIMGREILCFDSIDSTNNLAKKIAHEGCVDGTVVVAEIQTAGRGRLGRSWASTAKKGIWMSIVLRPALPPEDIQVITLAAAAAVARTIRRVTGISAGIKWPNDIILDGRKVCGILTEMSSDMEQVNFIVLGIGMNVNHAAEDFPPELQLVATSLAAHAARSNPDRSMFNRCEIIRTLLEELEPLYTAINNGAVEEIIDEWRRYSVTLGRQIKASVRNSEYIGTAVDITKDGKLVVDCNDGQRREFISGEVMVRGVLGYI
jgi:BirA family transcriptional regulator, biotin operon repressor / biotin---[acetyl-CoA-carboxylase] ligase